MYLHLTWQNKDEKFNGVCVHIKQLWHTETDVEMVFDDDVLIFADLEAVDYDENNHVPLDKVAAFNSVHLVSEVVHKIITELSTKGIFLVHLNDRYLQIRASIDDAVSLYITI